MGSNVQTSWIRIFTIGVSVALFAATGYSYSHNSSARKFSIADYVPMEADSFWEYKTNLGKASFTMKLKTISRVSREEGWVSTSELDFSNIFFSVSQKATMPAPGYQIETSNYDGIKLHAITRSYSTKNNSTYQNTFPKNGMSILPPTIAIGEIYKVEVNMYGGVATLDLEILDTQDLVVNGETFQNCLKISTRLSDFTSSADNSARVTQILQKKIAESTKLSISWFAKGVGLVLSRQHNLKGEEEKRLEISYSLVNYRIGADTGT